MKKFLTLLVLFALFSTASRSQTNEGQTSMYAIVANEDLPKEAVQNLTNKLSRAIAINGYGSLDSIERFVLVANVSVTGNDVVPTTPARISKKMDITLMVGDVVENKTFGSCCLSVAGIGTNDNKAYISAFAQFNPSNKIVKEMFDEASEKISKYYSDSTLFVTKARTFSQSGEYDRAIAYLMTVPPIDQRTYRICQDEIASIYRQKIDTEGLALYQQASGVWKSTRNLQGAKQVAAILEKVNPYSSAMPEIDNLWKEITSKLNADELAAIAAQERAHEERMQQATINAELTKEFLSAAKAVGMAFGIFQPRIVVNRIVRRWF